MKYFTSVLLIVITSFLAHSQTYEIGAMVGGTNFIGDVGNTTYIAPNSVGAGAIIKWNRSLRHAFRASILFSNLKGDDAKSHESRRNERGYTFENNITEFALGLEYNFWEYDIHSGKNVSTPYLFTGLSYVLYSASLIRPTDKVFVNYDKAGAVAIPMIIGYKFKFGVNFAVAIEMGARYTFTDDIDGSDPVKDLADSEYLKFGNVDNNDWYIFTGVNLSYTFGRKPCYCNF